MDTTKTYLGNVGRVEDASYTPGGKLIFKFSLAESSGYGDNKQPNWYNCVAWEKTAEFMNNSVQKGTRLLIEGRQTIRQYETKNGEKRTSVDVTVTAFEVLKGGKPREEAAEAAEAAEATETPSFF